MAAASKKPVDTRPRKSAVHEVSHPFFDVHPEFERIMNGLPMGWPGVSPYSRHSAEVERPAGTAFAPRVDATEDEQSYEIQAELPGMDESDIDISVSDGVLVLKGERHNEHDEQKKDYHISERSYGLFKRSFRVPDDVDVQKIAADFNKGVLSIKMPKLEERSAESRKISVSTG